jgi:hypothetical protein
VLDVAAAGDHSGVVLAGSALAGLGTAIAAPRGGFAVTAGQQPG